MIKNYHFIFDEEADCINSAKELEKAGFDDVEVSEGGEHWENDKFLGYYKNNLDVQVDTDDWEDGDAPDPQDYLTADPVSVDIEEEDDEDWEDSIKIKDDFDKYKLPEGYYIEYKRMNPRAGYWLYTTYEGYPYGDRLHFNGDGTFTSSFDNLSDKVQEAISKFYHDIVESDERDLSKDSEETIKYDWGIFSDGGEKEYGYDCDSIREARLEAESKARRRSRATGEGYNITVVKSGTSDVVVDEYLDEHDGKIYRNGIDKEYKDSSRFEIIVGIKNDGTKVYWNEELSGWTKNKQKATKYDSHREVMDKFSELIRGGRKYPEGFKRIFVPVISDVPDLEDDIVKTKKGWTNKGEEGTHGHFATKKAARQQQKAMFANGYRK